ncbi:GtrA family protein [Solirubrobacter taibaiensis]|nr:GtrA family protein [Solirubrobacter taibaiensis]
MARFNSLWRALMEPRAEPLRYVMVGGLTVVTYIGLTLVFAGGLDLAIQLAMLCAYSLSLGLHFTGQRLFVFQTRSGFELAMHHQARRYLLLGGAQISLSLTATTFLPGVIGVDERIVYAVATVVLAIASYLMLRFHVFHERRAPLAAQNAG